MKTVNVFHKSLQKTKSALFDVQLFYCTWTVGHVGAWGYELTYQDRKKQDLGLVADCEGNFHKPAIMALYQAITSLKRPYRIGIESKGDASLQSALAFGFYTNREFDNVPEWGKLVDLLVDVHSYHLCSVWYNNPWSPEHPLVMKVKEHANTYWDGLPWHEQSRLRLKGSKN